MADKHFTHLHLHTEFSLLDGAVRLQDLVKTAKQQEWKAVGISDHGNIFGAVKFFQLAKKELARRNKLARRETLQAEAAAKMD